MKKFNQEFKVGNKTIGGNSPTYFIADIAANHDGSLERAKELIFLAKESGADCAKFQHFSAKKIVSDYGFKNPKIGKISHQASWNKSVYDIYDQYHTRTEWTEELVTTCKEADIEQYSILKEFPIIPCNLCGSQDGLQRQAIKDMLKEWDRKSPGRKEIIFKSIKNISPSHMLDKDLFDFTNYKIKTEKSATEVEDMVP